VSGTAAQIIPLTPQEMKQPHRAKVGCACLDLANVEYMEPLESPAAPKINSLVLPPGRGLGCGTGFSSARGRNGPDVRRLSILHAVVQISLGAVSSFSVATCVIVIS